MYHTIIVPLDGSTWSEQALPLASALARRLHAAVQLVRVHIPIVDVMLDGDILGDIQAIDQRWDEQLRQEALDHLMTKAQAIAAEAGVKVSVHLLDGPVAATLAGYIDGIGHSMVVLTSHGRGGLARVWRGSVADALVRRVRAPLIVIRPQDTQATPEAELRHVLIALDGSRWAEEVIPAALEIGRPFDADYTLLQVVEPLVAHTYAPVAGMAELEKEASKGLCADAQHYLEAIAERLREQGVTVTTRTVLSRHPARAILEHAGAHDFDLVAMATHGRGSVGRVFLGSSADKVLRGSQAPVLMLRPQATTGAEVYAAEQPEDVRASW
jgi:nucleotide-binding universal stress UspA family protein